MTTSWDRAFNRRTCKWCPVTFAPSRRGGQEKEFCSTHCRNAYYEAVRRLGKLMIQFLLDNGVVQVADLRRHAEGNSPAMHDTETREAV